MAKELPYYKFSPGEWLRGDITLCSFEAQGVFISLCSYYWMKDCSMSLANAKLRFRGNEASVEELVSMGIIELDKDDNIIIKFLDEQMSEFLNISEKRAKSGSLGGQANAKQKEAKGVANSSYIDIDKEIDIDNKSINTLMSELKSSDHPHEKIAYNFWLLFSENLKKLKINSTDLKKAKYYGWVEPVRLMMERDKRTIEEFQEIFKYLKNEVPRENGFSWSSNIRSTAKLREKFEIILKDARMKPAGKISTVQNMANIRNNILQKIENGEFN